MNLTSAQSFRKRARAMTLVELMIAMAIGSLLVAAAGSLYLFGSRSFIAMGNYADLDNKSRNALDRMSQDLRQATAVTAFTKSTTKKVLTATNAIAGIGMTYTWEAKDRKLVCQKTGQPNQVYLTECDRWDFEFYQRTPKLGGTYSFHPATNSAGAYDLSVCKLIDMTWKCSRSILNQKENTESVQTAQVVLRNKQ